MVLFREKLLARLMREAGLAFASVDGPEAACLLIVRLAAGLEHQMRDAAAYVSAVRGLCRLAMRAA